MRSFSEFYRFQQLYEINFQANTEADQSNGNEFGDKVSFLENCIFFIVQCKSFIYDLRLFRTFRKWQIFVKSHAHKTRKTYKSISVARLLRKIPGIEKKYCFFLVANQAPSSLCPNITPHSFAFPFLPPFLSFPSFCFFSLFPFSFLPSWEL